MQDGYVAKKDRIGTKLDTPIAKIPQAVSVVTQKQIEDQKPRTLNESLGYTASANPNSFGFDTRYDAFFLRGFQAFYNGMFRDGLRQYNGPSAWFKTEPYGIEGVTILKGPASSLYGISGPGGIVNVVTKRPKDEPFHEIELLAGEHNRFQAGLDASGPVNADGSILYRFTSLGRLSETDLPGYPDDKLYLAPAVTFKPDEDTKLTILGEYSKSVTGGTAAFYNSAYGVLSNVYEGDPAWNDFDQTQGRIGYEFEHRFNDVLTVRQNLRYNAVDSDIEYSGHYSIGADQPLQRYWGHYTETMKNFVVDNMAQFEFDTGPVRHTAVGGIDYAWSDYDAGSGISYVSVDDIKSAAVPHSGGQEMNQLGVYLHDQMEWNDFTLFASGRYDWVDTTSTAADFSTSKQKDSAFSGRLGLSYQTEWGITPYVNYSTSFSPNIGFVFDDVTSTRRPGRPPDHRDAEGDRPQIRDPGLQRDRQRRAVRHRPEGRRRLRRLDRHQQAAPARPQFARRRAGGQCLFGQRLQLHRLLHLSARQDRARRRINRRQGAVGDAEPHPVALGPLPVRERHAGGAWAGNGRARRRLELWRRYQHLQERGARFRRRLALLRFRLPQSET